MMNSPAKWTPAKTGLVTALTAVACLGTLFVRIPIPITTGYFNVGDVFVILAALWLGPTAGLIVGALGPAAADAIGYPQFILATAVTKGCEGLVVGLIAKGARSNSRRLVAATIGAAVMVAGYFVFEAFVYPVLARRIPFFDVTTMEGAISELLPNTIQGVIAVVVGLGLFRAIASGGTGSPGSVAPIRS